MVLLDALQALLGHVVLNPELDVFVRRLNLFESTVGALEMVLGDVEDDLRRALLRAEGNVAEAVELFDRELDLKLKDAAQAEVQSADFLIELASFREETAKRLTAVLAEGRIRVDLEMLVLHILEHFPTAHVEARGDVYEIQTPPALARAVGAQLEDRYVCLIKLSSHAGLPPSTAVAHLLPRGFDRAR